MTCLPTLLFIQGRHDEFEPGKVQYSTQIFFDRLFFIRMYWNPKSRQGPNLACLAYRGGPVIHSKKLSRLKNSWFQMSSFASYEFDKKQIQLRSIQTLLSYLTKNKTEKAFSHIKTERKQMLLLNDCYTTVSGHIFAVWMFIFHKTEVQTVSLRCLTDLNPNLFKSYDTKSKYFHFCFFAIL